MSDSLHVPPPSERAFKRKLSAGFTLLELSIVLVIIGLLIGGIFVGQSLIKNAQLNAVIQESGRYQAATQAFKEQFRALPGDITNATVIWGSAGGTGSDLACGAIVSTTTATCNGDGDGVITVNGSTVFEELRYWQHLANAKMIEGSYAGTPQGTNSIPGYNIPTSKYTSAGWGVQTAPAGGAYYFTTDYGGGHILSIGIGGGYQVDQPALVPKDAWSIDKKIDDGKPGLGNVIAFSWPACTNAASNADVGTTYKLTDTNKDCGLLFLANF